VFRCQDPHQVTQRQEPIFVVVHTFEEGFTLGETLEVVEDCRLDRWNGGVDGGGVGRREGKAKRGIYLLRKIYHVRYQRDEALTASCRNEFSNAALMLSRSLDIFYDKDYVESYSPNDSESEIRDLSLPLAERSVWPALLTSSHHQYLVPQRVN
jgi:hypothetical protein